MTSYNATFSNGKTKSIKNSKRGYTHAFCFSFRFINQDGITGPEQTTMGFASSQELAQKAIQREFPSSYDKKRNKWSRAKNVVITFSEVVAVSVGGQ